MALSASNSEGDGDPDGEQIRKAKLISLGSGRIAADVDFGTPEALSRRYWDYNVLDYHEKVVDGFCDIVGLSSEASTQGKMPSLADLQTSIGDLGYEVIVVNHTIDTALLEMEQVAQCISMDCPFDEIALLVQRIAELVTENMGGPVKDANDMLTRWLENSIELRTSLQTSLLPIGCIKVGMSRHRALLFKILADNVGIQCKLVKGSHYTGIDEDAVNIIKVNSGREFLVDLMAAPGTLIPADVLGSKGTSYPSNPRLRQDIIIWTKGMDKDFSGEEESLVYNKGENGPLASDESWVLDKVPDYASQYPQHAASSNAAASGPDSWCLVSQEGPKNLTPGCTSSSKQDIAPDDNYNLLNLNTVPPADSVEALDSEHLFAELNPFRGTGVGKSTQPLKVSENRNKEYQGRRANISPGSARPQQPLVMKNWSAYNELSNVRHNNVVEGLIPRRNGDNAASSSQMPLITASNSNVDAGGAVDVSCATAVGISGSTVAGTSAGAASQPGDFDAVYYRAKVGGQLGHAQFHDKKLKQEFLYKENVKHRQKDRKEYQHDMFLDRALEAKGLESKFSVQTRRSRLDPMLDDVSEFEILWEDLVIGERIGLGSYGEVYRADWNGTEVAVKKFLDQDFYGHALDEFRSEVRIMRRLRHPNIVLFMGAVTRPPNLSIVSEFLPRGSLYKLIHRPNCPIDEKRRIKMALDVARGMNCLHTSVPTIVHRDLKSPNLLVDNNWTVKVCDFGLSRLKHNTFLSSKSTAGTPEWMAPEVLRNEPSNEKCDVYSFGVILWELATLRMPWAGMNPMQVVGAVGFQDRRLDIPKEVDPMVGRIILECWQTDPNLRPSFAQLTTALKSLERLVLPHNQEAPQSPPLTQEISVNSTP